MLPSVLDYIATNQSESNNDIMLWGMIGTLGAFVIAGGVLAYKTITEDRDDVNKFKLTNKSPNIVYNIKYRWGE